MNVKNLQKKKLKKSSKKKISKFRKIMWDDTYGTQPIMHALSDLGKLCEGDF
jgi:hypothetical protein